MGVWGGVLTVVMAAGAVCDVTAVKIFWVSEPVTPGQTALVGVASINGSWSRGFTEVLHHGGTTTSDHPLPSARSSSTLPPQFEARQGAGAGSQVRPPYLPPLQCGSHRGMVLTSVCRALLS